MFAQDFPPAHGGIQTYAHELALRFAQRAESFYVVAPNGQGARAFDRSAPFRIERVPLGGNGFAGAVLPKLLTARGAMTFHTQWPSAAAAVALRRGGGGGGICVAAHGREVLLQPWAGSTAASASASRGHGLRGWAARGYDAIRREAFRSADRVFAVSRYTAGLVRSLGVDERNIRVQGNGTDAERFRPRESNVLRERLGLGRSFVLTTVARLVPRKGVDRVIAALRGLPPEARLIVVGDGPERPSLERLTHELGLGSRVHFAGRVADAELPEYYAAADAFVLPATSVPPDVEGFGIAYLEASACGLPVIGPNCGGPLDAIEDGVTGLCVDPLDVEALGAAMARFVRERTWAAELGRAGRERVLREGTWDRAADALYGEMQEITRRG
jgi:phosphatidylinositol alpha-1,6-mannosyltransferase